MTVAALATIAAAMLLVRLGWAGRRRVASLGWTLALATLVALAVRDGAWGLAIGVTTGIVVALALVLHAGATSPRRTMRVPRAPPSVMIPRRPGDIARRVAVFVLVVPIAFAGAQGLAFGAQAMARAGGWQDADTTVLALFLQPMVWATIMAVQMTRATAARMVAPPVTAAAAGLLLWSLA